MATVHDTLLEMQRLLKSQYDLMQRAAQAATKGAGAAQTTAEKTGKEQQKASAFLQQHIVNSLEKAIHALVPTPLQPIASAGLHLGSLAVNAIRGMSSGSAEDEKVSGRRKTGMPKPVKTAIRQGITQLMQRNNLTDLAPAAAGGEEAAGLGAGAAEAAGGAVAALGPVGIAVGAVVAGIVINLMILKTALIDIPKAIYAWANSLLDSQRQLAQYSPHLAAVMMEYDARKVMREYGYGEQTAGSTGELARTLSEFEDNIVPIRALLTDLLNVIGVGLIKLLEALLEPLIAIAEWAGYRKGDPMSGNMRDIFESMEDRAKEAEKHPPRWQPLPNPEF